MKKILLSLVTMATISFTSFGQAPEGFKYQAVVRDASSNPMTDQAVGMLLTIQQGSIGGTVVYQETFAPTTNNYGLVNLEIGTGTSTDDFSSIDWSNGPYFIETAVDVTGGTSYAVMGTSQLMSVPYALYAKTSGLSANTTEPTYTIGLWPELGGYVFWVSSDGKHGLVAETEDQGYGIWVTSQSVVSDPNSHSTDGIRYRDWRMPTKYELNEMYIQRLDIGGFVNDKYWTTPYGGQPGSWFQDFGTGYQGSESSQSTLGYGYFRSVRSF